MTGSRGPQVSDGVAVKQEPLVLMERLPDAANATGEVHFRNLQQVPEIFGREGLVAVVVDGDRLRRKGASRHRLHFNGVTASRATQVRHGLELPDEDAD